MRKEHMWAMRQMRKAYGRYTADQKAILRLMRNATRAGLPVTVTLPFSGVETAREVLDKTAQEPDAPKGRMSDEEFNRAIQATRAKLGIGPDPELPELD